MRANCNYTIIHGLKMTDSIEDVCPFSVVEGFDGCGFLISEKDFSIGQEIFHEEPLLQHRQFPRDPNNTSDDEMSAQRIQIRILYNQYCSLSCEKKAKFDALYGSTQSVKGQLHFADISCNNAHPTKEYSQFYVKLHQNYYSEEYCLFFWSVFDNISRLTHSCIPNCTVVSDTDRRMYFVRAIRPIHAGDQLTINTLRQEQLAIPTYERRKIIFDTKEFMCECSRCVALGDDTRQFCCPEKDCKGRVLISQNTESASPSFLKCTLCGMQPNAQFLCETLLKEHNFVQALQTISRTKDVVSYNRMMLFITLSPYHGSTMIAEYLRCSFRFSDKRRQHEAVTQALAALAAAKECNIVQHIWIANMHLMISEALLLCNQVHLKLPLSYYKHGQLALRHAMVLYGREQTNNNVKYFTNLEACCGSQVSAANIITVDSMGQISGECSFCGVESNSDMYAPLKLCGRCKKVAYCCTQCQTHHWSTHKLFCNATVAEAVATRKEEASSLLK